MKLPALLLLLLGSACCLQAATTYSVESRLYVYRDSDFHSITLGAGKAATEHKSLAFHEPTLAVFDDAKVGFIDSEVAWSTGAPPPALSFVPLPGVLVDLSRPVALNATASYTYPGPDGKPQVIPADSPDAPHYKMRVGLAAGTPGTGTLVVGVALDFAAAASPTGKPSFSTVSLTKSLTAIPGQWSGLSIRQPNGSAYSVLLYLRLTPEVPPETELKRVSVAHLQIERLGAVVVADKRYIYVAGGRNNFGSLDSIERFDTMTAQSTLLPVKVRPRTGHAGAIVGGKLYLSGGISNVGGSDPLIEIIDLATNTLTTGVPMPWAAQGLAGAAVAGKVYFIGGFEDAQGQSGISNRVRIYNPASNTWSEGVGMPKVRVTRSPVVYNNEIFVIGGNRPPNQNVGIKTVEGYFPEANVWAPMPDLAAPFNQLATARVANRVYLFGDTGDFSSVFEYNLITGATTKLKSNFTPVINAGAAVVGRALYLVGGSTKNASDKSFDATTDVQIFMPPTG